MEVRRGADRPERIVLADRGEAEHGHDRVADVLLDDAAMTLDRLSTGGEVAVLDDLEALGIEALGQPAVVDQVGEHHRGDPALDVTAAMRSTTDRSVGLGRSGRRVRRVLGRATARTERVAHRDRRPARLAGPHRWSVRSRRRRMAPPGGPSGGGPYQLEDTSRAGEPSQRACLGLPEGEALLQAEIVDELGDEDMSGLSGLTDPAGKVHGRSEHVVVVVDGFAGGQADPDPKLGRRATGGARLEPVLDRRGALEARWPRRRTTP